MKISDIIDHIRNRPYMSGIERDILRVKSTGEVFTPTSVVQETLNKLPKSYFIDPEQPFIDPSCGDGQYLSEVLIKKLELVAKNGEVTDAQFEQALSKIYGVDFMLDNVDLCRERLLCGRQDLYPVVVKNIVYHDALTYDYMFDSKIKIIKKEEKERSRLARLKIAEEKKAKKLAKLEEQKRKIEHNIKMLSDPKYSKKFGKEKIKILA